MKNKDQFKINYLFIVVLILIASASFFIGRGLREPVNEESEFTRDIENVASSDEDESILNQTYYKMDTGEDILYRELAGEDEELAKFYKSKKGTTYPNVSIQNLISKEKSKLYDLDGGNKIVIEGSLSCPACQSLFKGLNKINKEKLKGVELVIMIESGEYESSLSDSIKDQGLDNLLSNFYSIFLPQESTMTFSEFGEEGVPTIYFLNDKNEVQLTSLGYSGLESILYQYYIVEYGEFPDYEFINN